MSQFLCNEASVDAHVIESSDDEMPSSESPASPDTPMDSSPPLLILSSRDSNPPPPILSSTVKSSSPPPQKRGVKRTLTGECRANKKLPTGSGAGTRTAEQNLAELRQSQLSKQSCSSQAAMESSATTATDDGSSITVTTTASSSSSSTSEITAEFLDDIRKKATEAFSRSSSTVSRQSSIVEEVPDISPSVLALMSHNEAVSFSGKLN